MKVLRCGMDCLHSSQQEFALPMTLRCCSCSNPHSVLHKSHSCMQAICGRCARGGEAIRLTAGTSGGRIRRFRLMAARSAFTGDYDGMPTST